MNFYNGIIDLIYIPWSIKYQHAVEKSMFFSITAYVSLLRLKINKSY